MNVGVSSEELAANEPDFLTLAFGITGASAPQTTAARTEMQLQDINNAFKNNPAINICRLKTASPQKPRWGQRGHSVHVPRRSSQLLRVSAQHRARLRTRAALPPAALHSAACPGQTPLLCARANCSCVGNGERAPKPQQMKPRSRQRGAARAATGAQRGSPAARRHAQMIGARSGPGSNYNPIPCAGAAIPAANEARLIGTRAQCAHLLCRAAPSAAHLRPRRCPGLGRAPGSGRPEPPTKRRALRRPPPQFSPTERAGTRPRGSPPLVAYCRGARGRHARGRRHCPGPLPPTRERSSPVPVP